MKNKIKVCPKCKSTNINLNITTSASYGAPQTYKCENCGFESYIISEKDKKKSKNKR